MKHQNLIGLILFLLEAAAFSYFTRTTVFPVLVSVVVVLGSLSRFPLRIDPGRRVTLALFLAVGFLIKSVVAPYVPNTLGPFVAYPYIHAIAQFFLSLQAVQFLTRGQDERLPLSLPLAGVLVMIGMADISATDWQSAVYQVCVFCFVILVALFYGQSREIAGNAPRNGRRIRAFACGTVLAGTVVCGGIGSSLLKRYWSDLEHLFERFQIISQPGYGSRIGFSQQSQLGSVLFSKTHQEDTAALRIYSTSAPGYLRGAAYDLYNSSSWQMLPDFRPVVRSQLQNPAVPPDPGVAAYFIVAPARFGKWRKFDVWPSVPNSDVLFSPLRTALFSAPIETLLVDGNQIAHSPELAPGQGFTAYAPAIQLPVESSPVVDDLTIVPEALDPDVRELAKRIFADCRSDREKLAAVQSYFRREYRYHLGIEIPPGVDPLNYFLLERPAAHCEYFASGATILLRLAGIPCRYVTGFVATERNPFGGYWVARNRDAHAWAEAFVDPDGWTIVEATPEGGIPQGTTSSAPSQLWDDFQLRVQMIRAYVAQGSWSGLAAACRALLLVLLTTLPGLIVTIVLLSLSTRATVRAVRSFPRRRREIVPHVELNRLLQRMDRFVKQSNLVRGPSETLHQFAARICATRGSEPALLRAADWYLRYAELRYRGEDDELHLAGLQRELAGLRQIGGLTFTPATRESASLR